MHRAGGPTSKVAHTRAWQIHVGCWKEVSVPCHGDLSTGLDGRPHDRVAGSPTVSVAPECDVDTARYFTTGPRRSCSIISATIYLLRKRRGISFTKGRNKKEFAGIFENNPGDL